MKTDATGKPMIHNHIHHFQGMGKSTLGFCCILSKKSIMSRPWSEKGDGGKKVTNMIGHAVCRGENIPKLNHYQLKM